MRWRSGASQSERCAVGSGRRWLSDDLAEKTKRCAVGWQFALAQLAVGIAEDTGVGVLGEERQHPLLAAAPLRDIVLLDEGIVAVERDGVEVQVERRPPGQAQPADGVEPVAHPGGITGGLDPAAMDLSKNNLNDRCVRPLELLYSSTPRGMNPSPG